MGVRINDGLIANYLGFEVLHPTSTVPAAQAYDLYTVVTGNVLVTSLIGLVTVQIGAGANAAQVGSNPTVGVIDYWDDGVGDLNGQLVGIMLAPTGDVAVVREMGNSVLGEMVNKKIVKPGVISITMAGATGGAGSISWVLRYIPLEVGAYVITA